MDVLRQFLALLVVAFGQGFEVRRVDGPVALLPAPDGSSNRERHDVGQTLEVDYRALARHAFRTSLCVESAMAVQSVMRRRDERGHTEKVVMFLTTPHASSGIFKAAPLDLCGYWTSNRAQSFPLGASKPRAGMSECKLPIARVTYCSAWTIGPPRWLASGISTQVGMEDSTRPVLALDQLNGHLFDEYGYAVHSISVSFLPFVGLSRSLK